MRFRFTIRDLLWFMAIVGILLSWGLDHERWASRTREAKQQALKQAAEAERVTAVLWQTYDVDAAQRQKIFDATGFSSHLVAGHGYKTSQH